MARMISIVAVAGCFWLSAAHAEKAAMPNLAGNYRCSPNPTPCAVDATAFTITQKGDRIEFKSDKGLIGAGVMTSPTTISIVAPWNMLGVVHKDGAIHWSNGTIWRKQ
jgi:hypothetical protein